MGVDEETSHCEHLLKETSTEGQDIKKVAGGRERHSVCCAERERDLSACPL